MAKLEMANNRQNYYQNENVKERYYSKQLEDTYGTSNFGVQSWSELKVALSQKVFHFCSNLPKKVCAKNYPDVNSVHDSCQHLFLGDFSQSEKLSETKPPYSDQLCTPKLEKP